MSSGLYTAVCGDIMQERRLEILSNNLANVSTAGFKEDRPYFGAIYPEIQGAPALTDQPTLKGLMLSRKMSMSYPALSGIKTDFSSGEIKHTGSDLDVAINGSGFFTVSTPKGELYTRMGNFSLNDARELVTQSGFPVMGQGQGKAIKIPGTEIAIDRDGNITVDGQQIDALKIETDGNFRKTPDHLESQGDSLSGALYNGQ